MAGNDLIRLFADETITLDSGTQRFAIDSQKGGRPALIPIRRLQSLENLIPLCSRHHHVVHEGGWNLKMLPDRTTVWTRPDGTVFSEGQSIDRVADGRVPARASPG